MRGILPKKWDGTEINAVERCGVVFVPSIINLLILFRICRSRDQSVLVTGEPFLTHIVQLLLNFLIALAGDDHGLLKLFNYPCFVELV